MPALLRTHQPAPAAGTTPLSSGLSAFRHRNYRLFFAGQFVSVTGTWMQTIAQSWLVLTLTSSAFKLGLVNVLQFTPILFIGLLSGVVADRFPRRRILICTQATSSVLAMTLALLTWTDNVRLWHIYALALSLGIVNAFDMPARQAFVGDMVSKDDLPNAIALNSSLFNAGRLIGPAVAGVLLSAFGPALCFTINSLSYLGVLTSLLMMSIPAIKDRLLPSKGLSQIREGLSYVRNTPAVAMTLMMVAVVGIFGLNFNVWMPLLAKNDLGTGAAGFGLLMAALGLGSLAGALLLAFRVRSPQPARMLATAALLGGTEIVLAIAAILGAPIPLALTVVVVLGFAMTSTMSMANTVVQSSTPPELRGRVMSVYMTTFAGSAPFGALLAGFVSGAVSAPASIMLGGAVTLAAVVFLLSRGGMEDLVPRTSVVDR
jgi:MFS family permease